MPAPPDASAGRIEKMFVKTWKGRSYDLGKMGMKDLVPAYLSFYAI